jgi:hypothetical protein
MTPVGVTASSPLLALDDSTTPTVMTGLDFLDAWRAALRPMPGFVPPPAGFVPASGDDADDALAGDPVETAIVGAVAAVARVVDMAATDAQARDAQSLARLVEGVEQLRRMVDAAATDVAATVADRRPFTDQGYFGARTFLKQRAQLSGPEAFRRLQTGRMRELLPEWADAARSGSVGVAQS